MDNQNEAKKILVTIDKTHLVTIGEKLYTEKTSFIRELVNNAFDADATEVYVTVTPERIVIQDDGCGMDESGLKQYFTIGASEKRNQDFSPKFNRKRIGEYGIGKFSALSISNCFEIITKKGSSCLRLIFDKEKWQLREDWNLDVENIAAEERNQNGTTIILHQPSVMLPPGTVRRYLSERAPIHVPHFAVFVNNERVTNQVISGRRIPIDISTTFGNIHGSLIIIPTDRTLPKTGIAIYVKQVLIRYEQFGLDRARKWGVRRITGKVNADFLPITSSRDDFLRDSEEFILFSEMIGKEIKKAMSILHSEMDRKSDLQASRVLKNALQQIGKAMKRNRRFFPETQIPIGQETIPEKTGAAGYAISKAKFIETGTKIAPELLSRLKKQNNIKRKRSASVILGNKSVIRNLSIAGVDIAVRMEHLGEREDESILAGGMIYINIDHPLYKTYRNNDELLKLHIARILTKEVALTTGVSDPIQAFNLQAELLTEAFKDTK